MPHSFYLLLIALLLVNTASGCLPGLGGSSGGACCPPGPSCQTPCQSSNSYVGPAAYAVAPPAYPAPPPPKYALAGK
ncbi:unnamed protein product [Caenorhabditis bovis]|uniref:Uncharacterized protein n=1 Tax=Caenorhabditis bovis TaxID=2654633 RepID=A0A8S1F8U3_9PELO|nr:unnamed protein product [Caenorhabditis bovis]